MKGVFFFSLMSIVLLSSILIATGNHNDETSSCTENDSSTCSSTATIPQVTLANGVQMPQLALGTAVLSANKGDVPSNHNYTGLLPEKVYRPVQMALEAGMRHIDAALVYRSHQAISHVLASWFASGKLDRKDIFLTTKIFHPYTPMATMDTAPDYENMTPDQVSVQVTSDFERSLQELGVGYVDLMLLHWPSGGSGVVDEKPKTKEEKDANVAAARARRIAAWKVLESYYKRGWARAIGVSNFNQLHLQQLKEDGATIMPMVNQIETSVYMRQESIIEYCQENGILIEAYSPLGRGVKNIDQDKVILGIADKHAKTPGQIALRFVVQLGHAVAFYSSNGDRIKSNMEIFSFELDEQDMEKLLTLNKPDGSWGLPSPYDLD